MTTRLLQPPFREKDLLTVDVFIRYCGDYGIRADRNELEYFEKEGLLFPAVRVTYGVVITRKVGKTVYYSHGVISHGQDGWLDLYRKRGLVSYPARSRSRPWADYALQPVGESEDPAVFQNACETFYTRMQVYPLKHLQQALGLRIVNAALYQSPEEWAALGSKAAAMFDRQRLYPALRKMIAEHYRFSRMFKAIEGLWEKRTSRLSAQMDEVERESKAADYKRSEREKRDDLRHHMIAADGDLSAEAKRILRASGTTMRNLENWRMSFLWYGTFGTTPGSGRRARPYLARIEDEDLARAEDPYCIIFILNWFIKLCGGKERSVKELILGFTGKRCVVCYRIFTPRKPSVQVTCGDPYCKAEHKNRLKRLGRQAGRYR